MSNTEQKSKSANDGSNVKRKSGSIRRLAVLLGLFVVAAGGITGYQMYLKSTMPKKDMNFAKQRQPGSKEPEEEQTGLEVLAEMFSAPKPSKQIEELKEATKGEVEFTYDEIMAMSADDLKKNIADLTDRLVKKRASLPPSLGGASAGGPPAAGGGGSDDGDKSTIQSLALPLEVMRQVAEGK